jgi:hypothetical protein
MLVNNLVTTTCSNGHSVSLIQPTLRFPPLDNANCGDVVYPEIWCEECQDWIPSNLAFKLSYEDLKHMKPVPFGVKRGNVSIMDGLGMGGEE